MSVKARPKHLTKEDWKNIKPYLPQGSAMLSCVDAIIKAKTINGAAEHLGRAQSSTSEALQRAIDYAAKRGWSHQLAQEVAVVEEITRVEEHRLKQQVKALQGEVRELAKENSESQALLDLVNAAPTKRVVPLKVAKPRAASKNEVAVSAFLSDTHFDEVVRSSEMGGYNEYNRAIAEKRLIRFAEKTIYVAYDLMRGFKPVHLDLPLGGDIISGNIHEELARTNEAEVMDTVMHWSNKLAQCIITLAKEFPTVRVPCVVGNHGRNTKKPRHKGRVMDNFDWLIYQWARSIVVQSAKNVEFLISPMPDVTWETMGYTYAMTHGDQTTGGQGWGGIFSPIMRLNDKKSKAYMAMGKRYDYLLMGHWHQFIDTGRVLVNGCLKGYDEFARDNNFSPEPPQQAFWLTSPKHGKIFSGPLLVDD